MNTPNDAVRSAASRLHYAWIVLAVGTLVVFGALGLARFGYTMLLPPMQAGLLLNNTQAGALATANLAGYLVLALVGGALAARVGPRVVIASGLAVAALGMLLTGLADSFGAALGWRALSGIGSGASNVPVMALLSAWFAQRRRGLASGIGVTGSSLGLILLGPMVPRLLAGNEENGWRICWFVFSGVTFGLAIVALAALRNRPAEIGLIPLGAAGDEVPALAGARGLGWSSVYRSGVMWHVGLIYVAFGFSYIIYMTFFTKYLVGEAHYTQAAAGRLFMAMGWLGLFCGLIWGWVSDVIGRKGALVIVYLIHTVAFGLFALWPSPAGLTLSAALFGLSAWSIPAIMAATCGDLLGPRFAPAGLGFVTLFFGLGQAAAPSAAGAVADAAGSLAPAMLLASGVAFLGALGSLLLRQGATTQQSALRSHAAIDVGTNSVKLHIALKQQDGRWRTLADRSEVTRLGEGLREGGGLAPEACDRTLDAIAGMTSEARGLGVSSVVAVGTMALRIASNRDRLIDAVRQRCGVEIEVLDGAEESRLGYLAVKTCFGSDSDRLAIFDTGGGSTQFTIGRATAVETRFSLNVGAVRLTEQWRLGGRVGADDLDRVLEAIAAELSPLDGLAAPDLLVGMGGAVTNLAAVKHGLVRYSPDAVQGTVLDRGEIGRQIELYRSRDAQARRQIPGLDPRRADIILAGACVVRVVMDKLRQGRLTVSDRGLRHGVLIDRFR